MNRHAVYMCILSAVATISYSAYCIGTHTLGKLPAVGGWLAMTLAWAYQIQLDRR